MLPQKDDMSSTGYRVETPTVQSRKRILHRYYTQSKEQRERERGREKAWGEGELVVDWITQRDLRTVCFSGLRRLLAHVLVAMEYCARSRSGGDTSIDAVCSWAATFCM